MLVCRGRLTDIVIAEPKSGNKVKVAKRASEHQAELF